MSLKRSQIASTHGHTHTHALLATMASSSSSSIDALPSGGTGGPGFNGDVAHFAGWKMQMESVLDFHGLLDVVKTQIEHSGYSASSVVDASTDGGPVLSEEDRAKLPKPKPEEIQKGKKAFMLIMTALKSHVVLSLVADVPRGNAYGLWRCLTAHYSRETAANKNHLLQVYHALRQGNGESAAMYIARVKQAVSSLSAVGEVVSRTSMLATFAGGLLSEYAQLRMMLPFLAKDLPFEEVCSMVLSTEAQIAVDKRASSSSGGFGGRQVEQAHAAQQQRRDGGSRLCYKCGKSGHLKVDCKGADIRKCTYCSRSGHVVEQCFDKQKGVPPSSGARNVSAMASETTFETLLCVEVMQVVDGPVSWAQVASGVPPTVKPFALDSGASKHFVDSTITVQNAVVNEGVQIRVASGEILASPSVGSIVLQTSAGKRISLKGVMSHPKMCANLLSVSSLCGGTNGGGVWFTEKKALVINAETAVKINAVIGASESGVLLEADCRRGLYMFDAEPVEQAHSVTDETPSAVVSTAPPSVAAFSDEEKRWHYRLAHLAPSGMKKLKSSGGVVGLEDMPVCADGELCAACMRGKAHREPFREKVPERARATRVLERVHADLCGPITESLGGSTYMLLIVDEFSRKVFGYFVARKSDAAGHIMQWCRQAVAQTGKPIVEFHTDGGGEFTSNELGAFYVANGIKATTTQPHTPQQNGIVERANRYIMESVRSMLSHAVASKRLWAEFAMAAIHIRNRSVVRKGTSLTSESLWTGATAKPSVAALRVIGCDAWIHVPDVHRTKLEDKSRLGVLIGYNAKTLGYRVMDARTRVVWASRDVRFEEGKFSQCAEMVRSLGQDDTDFEYDLNAAMHSNEMRLVLMISKEEEDKRKLMLEDARAQSQDSSEDAVGAESVPQADDRLNSAC
jgi:transposase InsO family protein